MSKPRKLAGLVIAAATIAGVLLIWFWAQRERVVIDHSPSEPTAPSFPMSRSGGEQPSTSVKGATAAEPDSAKVSEYLLLGFVPYQSDADLDEMGFTTAEQKALAQQLFAKTFFILVETLAKNCEVSSTPGKALLTCELSDETYEGIRERFFAEVREIIGQPTYDKLLQSDRLYFINKQLLGFGEFPVMMQLTTETSPAGEPQVRFTFSTQLDNRTAGTDSYFRSQRLPVEIINERFAAVREATKGSAFVWPE